MYHELLKEWIAREAVAAEVLVFPVSCHSVAEAADAAGVTAEDFVKSICLMEEDGSLLVAVVKGEGRVDRKKIGRLRGKKPPRLATPEEILLRTGYPCGGTPPFGFQALFLVDARVLERELLYAGGGDENVLLRLSPAELLRANGGSVADIAKG